MNQVLVLVGPTAVGKTAFSIELAKQFQGEIISGDSIQVYRGLNIGSGKICPEEMQGVPHFGLDILDPRESTSVADFQKRARAEIADIAGRGHLPMIVGGTGLYVKATLYDYEFHPQPPEEAELTQKLEQESEDTLYQKLMEIDPDSARQIHPHNKRRVIRALVIHEMTQTRKSENEQRQTHQPIYDALIVGLTCDREILRQRIEKRVHLMLETGLKQEVEGLLKQGVRFTDQSMQGIGYKEWQGYFNGTQSEAETAQLIITHTRQFSRRQMTWFTRQTPIHWVDSSDSAQKTKILESIGQWRKGAAL